MSKITKTEQLVPVEKVDRLLELQKIVSDAKPEIEKLKQELLTVTQDLDVYTLRTGDFTITRANRVNSYHRGF